MLHSPVTKEEFAVDHYFVRAYGMCTAIKHADMILVDAALCKRYPLILPH